IAVIGTCVPRQCGIATFTNDLQQALKNCDSDLSSTTIALTDDANTYAYPPDVALEIQQATPASYAVAADFLNVSNVD
ncbi:hypothetical protein, partial [Klebsiella pneumoniae]